MSFKIVALDHHEFAKFFAMSDSELATHNAVRRIAQANSAFPCRVSLRDAQIGDELVLVNYEHQPCASPYRASHAIFVRKDVPTARLQAGAVPELFHNRALSLRAFDNQGMIVSAELVPDGAASAATLTNLLDIPAVAYVHIHFAKFGCYAARAERA